MLNQTLDMKDKDVVVLGLGRSGMAAATLLRRDGARVVVRDEADNAMLAGRASRLRELGVRVELGNHFDLAKRFDLAVLSPGIAPERPIVREVVRKQTPVLSELELAYRFCLCPIIGVTGTNGKTTTTELIATMLNHCGKYALAAGNIGNALSEAAEGSAGLDELVVEVSSFQLETVEQFRPHVSVLMNVTPDHLDRYPSMLEYARAKGRIFQNQTSSDVAVVSVESLEWMRRAGCPIQAPMITFTAYGPSADLWLDLKDQQTIWCQLPCCRGILLKMEETNLHGVHNAENVMAALAVGLALDLPITRMLNAVASYCPQPHRCEFVASVKGVTYINDSKGTNTDAVAKAVGSMPGPVVLIAGGRDKGLDYSTIEDVVAQKVKLVLAIGEAREKICHAWGRAATCIRVASMEEAVRVAAAATRPGDTVLLSPACSSFDMFENYEHRGEEFKREVYRLPNSP
jgi:UDP-N-acetylmuramoylalanine--D-glutamate ligase